MISDETKVQQLNRKRTNHMKAVLIRALCAGSALAILSQPVAAATAPASLPTCEGAAPVTIQLKSEWSQPRTTFAGWGTSLAWFASTTGTWPDPVRNRLADLLYGPNGLGWTIARYNIGGGRKPGTPPLSRANANVPGMWRMPTGATGKDWWRADDPAMWDWTADPGQQWWLAAVKSRVPEDKRIIEAAAYSPPWFMTVSEDVAGGEKPLTENLRPGFEAAFADYLVRAMKGLEARHGIRFHSLAPLNEPNTPYWVAGNRQEGNYFSPSGQARMLIAADKALREHRMAAILSAMDETNPDTFVVDWADYPDAARAVVRQLNVHTYSTTGSTGPRDIATVGRLPLWMSEVDLAAPNRPQDFADRSSALALGEQIVLDFKRLEPAAWVVWQAVEPKEAKSNWGLVQADMSSLRPADMSIEVTAKYWAMAQFSRHIRPGFRLVRNDDPDTVTAIAPDGREAVVVHVNHGPYPRRLAIDTAGLRGRHWSLAGSVSDDSRQAAQFCHNSSAPRGVIAPPRGITTFRLIADR
ncbi:glycoside hydrolase [Sphingopyxis sp. NJF-3]